MAVKNNKILEVTGSVKWIGILDYDIVTFDIVMETTYGTTYNSYFIDAAKKAVIDTAKETFKDNYLDKIRQVTDPKDIAYIVINHSEPDHSGAVRHLLELAPDAIVYGSRQAINYLGEMMSMPFKSVVVKDGDTLNLGNKTLRFIGAPNLHWPDSIFTFLEEEGILFTCDSFGAHFCDEHMFDDLVPDYSDAFKYYFDVILKPFGKFMERALDKIEGLDIKMICPGHGPVLRKNWRQAIARTREYTNIYLADSQCLENNILITYVSAYGYTRQMAEIISKGISEVVDYKINIIDLEHILLGDLEELIVKSNSILVGSPTINQNTVLPVYKLFAVINPIRDKGKKAAAFGSFGWSGEAVRLIENHLSALKLDVVCEGISSRFSPSDEESEQLQDFGRRFGRQISSDNL